MEEYYSLYDGNELIGTIINIYNCWILSTSDKSEKKIKLTKEKDSSIDPELLTLSSEPYILTYDNYIIKGEKKYSVFLPKYIRFKAMPIISNMNRIIDYIPRDKLEELFIEHGYAKEVKNSLFIILTDKYEHLLDMLIKDYDFNNKIFTSFSGRRIKIKKFDLKNRYIYPSSSLIYEGKFSDVDKTYTMESLCSLYDKLNNQFYIYCQNKSKAIFNTLQTLSTLIEDVKNPYKLSELYDYVVKLSSSIKESI